MAFSGEFQELSVFIDAMLSKSPSPFFNKGLTIFV
jgi:hypothetical protein